MVTPTTGAEKADTLTARLDELAADLRSLYTRAFQPALEAASEARQRFEAADGTDDIDPVYSADVAGCRAVNVHLAETVRRRLPGAKLLARIDEPAVIDSCWLYLQAVVIVEWDHSYDFGDPDALIVRELGR